MLYRNRRPRDVALWLFLGVMVVVMAIRSVLLDTLVGDPEHAAMLLFLALCVSREITAQPVVYRRIKQFPYLRALPRILGYSAIAAFVGFMALMWFL